MRYINLRFTYLLIYLHNGWHDHRLATIHNVQTDDDDNGRNYIVTKAQSL